jgi:hypothetical protein
MPKRLDKETRETMVQIQLKNLKSLLDADVHHQSIINSKGQLSYRYLITYQEKDDSDINK